MKRLWFTIALFVPLLLFAQERDTRAILDEAEFRNTLKVSPTGKLWMSTMSSGKNGLFCAPGIHSTWITVFAPQESYFKDETDFSEAEDFYFIDDDESMDTLEETYPKDTIPEDVSSKILKKNDSILCAYYEDIVFPDPSSILIVGRIRVRHGNQDVENVCLLSHDEGKTWTTTPYSRKDDDVVEQIYTNGKGLVWLCCGNGVLYFSKDSGKSFVELPYRNSELLGRSFKLICMADAQKGYAIDRGISNNELFFTQNNWATYQKIQTPLQQYPNLKDSLPDKIIDKIRVWNDYVVVQQGDRIFYSKQNPIEWKRFPLPADAFETDAQNEELYVLVGRKVYRMSSPSKYQLFYNQDIMPSCYSIIGIVDGKMYCSASANDGVVCVSKDKVEFCGFYTEEHPIPTPPIVFDIHGVRWGCENRDNSIYQWDEKVGTWFRIYRTNEQSPFTSIVDMRPYPQDTTGQSVVILSREEDDYHNFLFTALPSVVRPYQYEFPLSGFLESPVQKIILQARQIAFLGESLDEITYIRKGDVYKTSNGKGKCEVFHSEFSAAVLDSMLNILNQNPHPTISIRDFEITKHDIDTFRHSLFRRYVLSSSQDTENYDFLSHFADTVLSVSDAVVTESFTHAPYCISTGSSFYFNIWMVNQRGDTLHIQRSSDFCVEPSYALPAIVSTDNVAFASTNVAFMKFIKSIMMPNMLFYNAFENESVIRKVGEWGWRKEGQ